MDDISNKLSEILSSPDKLEQVMQLAGGLVGTQQPPNDAPPAPSPPTDTLSALSTLDPKLLGVLAKLLGSLNADDSRTALLRALKPHLKSERADKVDRAVQILRISGALKTLLASLKGGENDVFKI